MLICISVILFLDPAGLALHDLVFKITFIYLKQTQAAAPQYTAKKKIEKLVSQSISQLNFCDSDLVS